MPMHPHLSALRCSLAGALALLSGGCVVLSQVVHDGLATTLVDDADGRPLSGVGMYAAPLRVNQAPSALPLAISDADGRIDVPGRSERTLTAPGADYGVAATLVWVCRPGYRPQRIGIRHNQRGPNVPTVHRPAQVRLVAEARVDAEQCAQWPSSTHASRPETAHAPPEP
ncbi:hypothetical protein [Stenotrophomonas mori]|uniref:Carboxypeptidase regulatory-like domain-containing protein n=1 Tax=Stenotrophomonas mori TaxID=2871096 RepID=A0ABT0SKJ9_9GAMM|nr:hypothetical protein [Stenotrophomonas mori]MCL7715792.1 hypothetical protein [Stenotrophomonas mori]